MLRHSLGRVRRSLLFPSTILFAAILVATGFGWQAAKDSLHNDIRTAADRRVRMLELSLNRELTSYEQILRGGVGLFRASDEVTSSEWSKYLHSYDITEGFTGVQAIGYAKVFPASDAPYIADYLAGQGINNFEIRPAEPQRDIYAVAIYVEVTGVPNPNPTYGFDMYSEPVRREAMFRARDTGQTTITSRLVLASVAKPVGFNMYVPHYCSDALPGTKQERQQTLCGYVFATFRANAFFTSLTDAGENQSYRISIGQDSTQQTLYESSSFKELSARPRTTVVTKPFSIFGQTWTIEYAIDPSELVSDTQLKRPGGVIFFGVFSAILITTIIFLLLRQRQKALEAQKERDVEQAKEELLSLASHQLRTPATGVKQYIGMILQGFAGTISKEQKPLLEKAYASNDRQLQVINEILHMAKIDSGRVVLARQQTTLQTLLRDIVQEQRSEIENAGHTFTLKLPKKHIDLFIDNHMLRMAIENLLTNAIKYTPRGGHITVKLRQDNTHVTITVTDTGIGIHHTDFPQLFKQFTRLPNEMSQRVSGTGVGLYLAKHLVMLHNGTVEVESRLGEGATFTITLPIDSNTQEG